MKYIAPVLIVTLSSACSGAEGGSFEDATASESDSAEKQDSAFSFADLQLDRDFVPHDTSSIDFTFDNPCIAPPLTCGDIKLQEPPDAGINVYYQGPTGRPRAFLRSPAGPGPQNATYGSDRLQAQMAQVNDAMFPVDTLRCQLPDAGEVHLWDDTYHLPMEPGTICVQDGTLLKCLGGIVFPEAPALTEFGCDPRRATLSAPGAYDREIILNSTLVSSGIDPQNQDVMLATCRYTVPAEEIYVDLTTTAQKYDRGEGNRFLGSEDDLTNVMCLSDSTCLEAGGAHTECASNRCCAYAPF